MSPTLIFVLSTIALVLIIIAYHHDALKKKEEKRVFEETHENPKDFSIDDSMKFFRILSLEADKCLIVFNNRGDNEWTIPSWYKRERGLETLSKSRDMFKHYIAVFAEDGKPIVFEEEICTGAGIFYARTTTEWVYANG